VIAIATAFCVTGRHGPHAETDCWREQDMSNDRTFVKPSGRAVRAHARHPLAAALALTPLFASALALAAPVTHVVTTCDDPPGLPLCNGIDDGTARQALACALDGDTVDLSALTCSTITLSAPLIVGTVGIAISGPGAEKLAIDAGNQFRVLVHNGRPGDTLYLDGLTLRNGRYENPYTSGGEGGGCIFSSGNLYLSGSVVESCYTKAAGTVASGGAIFAKGTATLLLSAVSKSVASGSLDTKYAAARGGGICADTVEVIASSVTGNAANSPNRTTVGGGVYAQHFSAKYATIAGNVATSRAGVSAAQSFVLASSTLSGNSARDTDGGAHLTSGQARVTNSTIAFNSAGAGSTGGISGLDLRLESSIIAGNVAGGVGSDVGSVEGGISGSHNLIQVSNVAPPADTIGDDPLLGPLQDNGGLTPTHAPSATSPAIDHGSNPDAVEYDQRLYPRAAQDGPDIGAVEYQIIDRIFGNGFQAEAIDVTR
jgi:hypothetical protein